MQELFERATSRPWSDERTILIKFNNNAPQEAFIPLVLSEPGFIDQVTVVWYKARLRQYGQSSFQLMVFVYVAKVERAIGLRRVTERGKSHGFRNGSTLDLNISWNLTRVNVSSTLPHAKNPSHVHRGEHGYSLAAGERQRGLNWSFARGHPYLRSTDLAPISGTHRQTTVSSAYHNTIKQG